MTRPGLFGLAALLAASAFAEGRAGVFQLGTLSAAGATIAIDLTPVFAHKHTVQAVITGSPATCSMQLEGTLDDPQAATPLWSNLSGAQVCTSSVLFHVSDRVVRGIRVNLTALTGGTAPTVTVKYAGVQ